MKELIPKIVSKKNSLVCYCIQGIIIFFFFLSSLKYDSVYAQVYIPFSGSNSISCGTNTTLCTHAGCGATYSNSANGYTVIYAAATAVITISGTYDVEPNYDYIRIYDGVGTGGTLLATYNALSTSFTYTGSAGQTLTVQFTSDGSVVYTGLNATVSFSGSCASCPTPTAGAISFSVSGCDVSVSNVTSPTNYNYIEWYRWNYSNSTWTYLGQNNSTTITDAPGLGQYYYLRRVWSSCYGNCSSGCIDATTGTVTVSAPSIPQHPGTPSGMALTGISGYVTTGKENCWYTGGSGSPSGNGTGQTGYPDLEDIGMGNISSGTLAIPGHGGSYSGLTYTYTTTSISSCYVVETSASNMTSSSPSIGASCKGPSSNPYTTASCPTTPAVTGFSDGQLTLTLLGSTYTRFVLASGSLATSDILVNTRFKITVSSNTGGWHQAGTAYYFTIPQNTTFTVNVLVETDGGTGWNTGLMQSNYEQSGCPYGTCNTLGVQGSGAYVGLNYMFHSQHSANFGYAFESTYGRVYDAFNPTFGCPCTPPSSVLATTNTPSICTGSAANFQYVSHTGGTLGGGSWEYQWEDGSNTVVRSWNASSTYSPVLTSTATYHLHMRSTACTSNVSPGSNAVTVTVYPAVPSTPGAITGTAAVCPGISGLIYSISAVPNAATYTWTVPTGWVINSGQNSTSISVTSGNYGQNGNVTVTAGNACGTSSAQSMAVTINPPIPATPGAISGTAAVCPSIAGLVYSVTAVPYASTYTWTVPTGWTITGGAGTTSITVTSGTAGQNGNITVTAGNSCGTSSASILAVSVGSVSTAASSIGATATTICSGNSTTLSVVGGSLGTGASWKWYSGSCGGTLVGTGNSIIVSPAVTTTYYLRAEGNCNTTVCVSQTITVNTLSTAPTSINATATTICSGSSVTLTVVGGSLGTSASWVWYSVSCGGTPAGTGNSIVVSPTISTTFYVRAEGTCNNTTCASVAITVNSLSVAANNINETVNPICSGNSTTLMVDGGTLGTGASWKWYSGSCGGTLVGTGSSISVSPTSTTTYFLRAEGTCNTTACVSKTITVTNCILGFTNYGAKIKIIGNAYIYIDGDGNGDFSNELTGTVDNQGTIRLEGDWANDASSGNVFISNNGMVEFLGGNQSIRGSASTYFNNVKLSGTGIKKLEVNTLVGGGFASPAGVLNLQGLPLNLNQYTLTVSNPSNAAITRTTGYIISENENSKVKWNIAANTGSYSYPFGRFSGSLRYIPFVFNITAGGTGATGSVTLSTYHTISNNTPYPSTVTNMNSIITGTDNSLNVADRFWIITPANYTANPTADLTFNYEYASSSDNEFYSPNTITELDLQAQRWNGTMWVTPPVGSDNTTNHNVQVTGVSTFSPWVLVMKNNPLPVELLSFSALCEDQQVDLSWSTASELNCDRFDIEKSKDLINWYFVTTVLGSGTSNTLHEYSAVDNSPYSGISYYSLKQYDYNGVEEIYGPVSTECIDAQENTFEIINILPNETKDELNITYNVFENCRIQAYVIDALGQQLASKKENAQAGMNILNLDLKHSLSIGIYMVTIEYNDKIFTQKIFIH